MFPKRLIPAPLVFIIALIMLVAPVLSGISFAQNGSFPVPPGRIVAGDEDGLFTILADGTEKTYLLEEDEPSCWLRDGVWNPAGTQVLYTRICGGSSPTDWRPDPEHEDLRQRTAEVFIYDLTTEERRELISNKGVYQDYAGAWHPDGKQVVIYSDRDENAIFNFYMVDLANSDLTQLTNFNTNASRVSLDPTGRYLLFNRLIIEDNSIAFEVRAFDITGQSEIRVAQGLTPNWSPDGKWITYATEGRLADVFIMPATCIYNGGECNAEESARNMTYTPDIHEREPVFSPDQSQLVYLRDTDSAPNDITWDLYRHDLLTGLLQKLTNSATVSERHRSWELVVTDRVEIETVLPVIISVKDGQRNVNLRAAPNTNSNIVGQVPGGQIVFVQGTSPNGSWYYITLPEDGTPAWLFADLTILVEGDPASTPTIQ